MKILLFEKGKVYEYQAIIEEKIGNFLGKLDCYDDNYDNKKELNGVDIDPTRAYFNPDADYELIIRKKRNVTKEKEDMQRVKDKLKRFLNG